MDFGGLDCRLRLWGKSFAYQAMSMLTSYNSRDNLSGFNKPRINITEKLEVNYLGTRLLALAKADVVFRVAAIN